jgi:dihydroorotate dehydrogenase electron transfer subunit
MTASPLDAPFYADRAVQRSVEVLENVSLARDTFRLRFRCPEIARRVVPGQFVMVRLPTGDDPLLARALALYDAASKEGDARDVDVVYLVVGKLTTRLASLAPGALLDVWGPLGNGFLPQPTEHLIMVAGGIGQTPFLALAKESLGKQRYGDPPRMVSAIARVTLCYGARTADLLAGLEDFERIGVRVHLSTDDGTRGDHGPVGDVLKRVLETQGLHSRDLQTRIVCCGPEPMMEKVAIVARESGIPCQASLETPMACGLGICFSCVANVRDKNGEWDYKRTCVEGPVFDAQSIEW